MLAPTPAKRQAKTKQLTPAEVHIQQQEMDLELLANSIKSFKNAEQWVKVTITQRLKEIEESEDSMPFQEIAPAPEWLEGTAWHDMSEEFELGEGERFMMALIFTAQFQPSTLMPLWANEQLIYWAGGKRSNSQINVVPTLRTVLFLLAGMNSIKRAYYYSEIADSRLFREMVLVTQMDEMDTMENALLKLNDEYYRWLMNGKKVTIEVSADFPAVLLNTKQKFSDLVHKESVLEQLEFLMDYARHQDDLYGHEDFAHKVKPGYVAMLYGPPGTGKTMTVAVMGKELGLDVYAIDLSRVVSKYIGETEKNLEKIFQRLEGKNCILFFDEADALFGKRTEVKDARDRYANQEVAYLLQKIERFPGLVILASNYNQNLDKAFRRRILTSIFVAPPAEKEREILWNNAMPGNFSFESAELPFELANEYQLTGANIANIIKLACIKSKNEGTTIIRKKLLTPLIKMEQSKEKNLS